MSDDINNKNEHKQLIIGLIVIIVFIALIAVIASCSDEHDNNKNDEIDTESYSETTENDYNNNDIDYADENYTRTNTKYLYNNLGYYYCDPVTTTIKINYIDGEFYCAYVVQNTSKYKNFTVAFDFSGSDYTCAKYKKGDYITVSGYADGTSYDKGTVIIDVDMIEPTDKSLFNTIKSKSTKPKSMTDGKTLIYSDDNVNIYFDDIETDEYYEDEFLVYYLVENKSNTQYTFQGDTLTLDGISYNDITMSDPVAPKSTGRIEANIDGKPNTIKPKTVGIGFIYFDDNFENTIKINASSVKIK